MRRARLPEPVLTSGPCHTPALCQEASGEGAWTLRSMMRRSRGQESEVLGSTPATWLQVGPLHPLSRAEGLNWTPYSFTQSQH